MSVRRLTAWEEIELWWTLKGELQHDLLVYYVICSIVGYLQGYAIGCAIIGRSFF